MARSPGKMGSRSLLWALVLIGLLTGARGIACPADVCTCNESDSDMEMFCQVDGAQVIFRYCPQIFFTVECKSDRLDYSKLPRFGLSNESVRTLAFVRCPLPEPSIGHVAAKLGIARASTVKFEKTNNRTSSINRRNIAGLGSMQTTRLQLYDNAFADLPRDLLADSENITWVSLRANSVNPPVGFFEHLPKLETLEISESSLSHIPEGMLSHLSSLKRLYLWHDKIHNLTKPVLKDLVELRDLEVSGNGMVNLSPDVFESLEKLSTASLHSNNFSSLPNNLFSNNSNLERVILFNNNLKISRLPDYFLSNKSKLVEVELRHIGLEIISDTIFQNSFNIVNISLEQNEIEVLPLDLFKDQVNLENLKMERNKITSLPDGIFINQKKLKYLDLSYNYIENLSRLEGLSNLRELIIHHNRLTILSKLIFPVNSQLINLDMSHNQISFADYTPISDSDDFFASSSPFNNIVHLKYLDLNHNNITKIYFDWKNMLELATLNLSHNLIDRIQYNDLTFLSNNKLIVDLTHNNITVVNFTDAMLLNQRLSQGQDIPVVRIGNNPFECSCLITHFVVYLDSIRNDRDFESHKDFEIVLGNSTCATSTKGDLTGRQLESVKPKDLVCPLDDPDSNEILCPRGCQCYVRTNDLANIIECTDGAVDSVPNIPVIKTLNHTELNLSNNKLGVIRRSGSMPDTVTELYLDGNNLTQLSLGDIPNDIEVLSLKNNRLTHLNASIAAMVVNGSRLQELWLSGNPFACDCDNVVFLSLLQKHRYKIKDYGELVCPDGQQMEYVQIGSLCGAKAGVLSASVIAVLAIIAGLATAVYYKYNHEIKVFLFAKGFCLWLIAEEELDKDKQYDAFVSFSHKDEEFVINELMNPLEKGAFPFKLCVHVRDWIAGEVIQDQIAQSVQNSRRTIIVLSQNFLDSEWGKIEFRLAHEHAMKEHRSRVIIVLYGDVNVKALDDELKAYLTTNTYVKWGDPWFLDKLRYALPHPNRHLLRDVTHASITKRKGFDDRLELINPTSPTTPPGSNTPPAHQATNGSVNRAPLPVPITKFPVFNGYSNGAITMNGLKVNGNAKHSEV